MGRGEGFYDTAVIQVAHLHKTWPEDIGLDASGGLPAYSVAHVLVNFVK